MSAAAGSNWPDPDIQNCPLVCYSDGVSERLRSDPDHLDLSVIHDTAYQAAAMELLYQSMHLAVPEYRPFRQPSVKEGDTSVELIPTFDDYPAYSSVCVTIHANPEEPLDGELMASIRVFEDLYGEEAAELPGADLAHRYSVLLIDNKNCVIKERFLVNYETGQNTSLGDLQIAGAEDMGALLKLMCSSGARPAGF